MEDNFYERAFVAKGSLLLMDRIQQLHNNQFKKEKTLPRDENHILVFPRGIIYR